jgi:hypothetical protein
VCYFVEASRMNAVGHASADDAPVPYGLRWHRSSGRQYWVPGGGTMSKVPTPPMHSRQATFRPRFGFERSGLALLSARTAARRRVNAGLNVSWNRRL